MQLQVHKLAQVFPKINVQIVHVIGNFPRIVHNSIGTTVHVHT